MNHKLFILILGFFIVGAITPRSVAQGVQCKGVLGRITVQSLYVPAKRSCILKGTTVMGNITVGKYARLVASDANIQGNVFAKDALYLDIDNLSEVKGVIQRPALLRSP